MALQPAVFGTEGVGDGHGLGGDIDFEAVGEGAEDLLRAGHEGEIFEEIFGVKEGAELLAALGGGELPKALAGEIGWSDGFVEGLVVAAQVLGEGVGHDFVHVDADTSGHDRLLKWR